MTGDAAGFSGQASYPAGSADGPLKFRVTPDYYQFSFTNFPDIICAFSTRARNYDFRAAGETALISVIREARIKFLNELGVRPEQAVFLEQVHGAHIRTAGSGDRGSGVFDWVGALPASDAVITQGTDIALCLLTADCLPLLLVDPCGNACGAVHAGWRGSYQHFAEQTVNEMIRTMRVLPEELMVVIGPGIRSCCYEVSAELQQNFPHSTMVRNGRIFLDLAAENIRQLQGCGIKPEHIIDTSLCSCCNREIFFSYRSGDSAQRMLTVIMRRNPLLPRRQQDS